MYDRKWEPMREDDFDALLKDSLPDLPPEDVVADVTPWKKAMNRVLTGLGLTSITLNFLYLDYILPAIGMVLLLLGFRALRRENRWFGTCFGITLLRAVYLFANLILNSTILQEQVHAAPQMIVLTGIDLALLFVEFFCIWGGFRAVQRKADLPPHAGGAVALMVWYGILCLLALVGYVGLILGVVMIVVYICIICSLRKLSGELDEAGYTIRPAPVRLEDGTVALAITILLVGGCICGWLFGGSYPMEWTPVDAEEHSGAAEIKSELLELGVPDYVVNDLAAEDLAACDGALRAVVETCDEPLNNDKQKILHITGVAVELPGERERWMVIQHFLWEENPGFYGTESIQLWPAYQDSDGWRAGGAVTGRVLYDKNGQTYSAPYWFLGEQTFASDSIFWGQQTSSDVFAAFSMPNSGENHRGYVAYPIEATQDGYLISGWFNYTHQRVGIQYPAVSAMENRMRNSWNDAGAFFTMQYALQFFPSELEEAPVQ